MATNKTNQPTTERDTDHIMRNLDIARAFDDVPTVELLTAELKKAINSIFNPNPAEIAEETAHVAAIAEDTNKNTVTVELAHREAIAEDAKRNFCTDFQKKAAALPLPDLDSAFAKEVGAFLDKLTNKGE